MSKFMMEITMEIETRENRKAFKEALKNVGLVMDDDFEYILGDHNGVTLRFEESTMLGLINSQRLVLNALESLGTYVKVEIA